jgi:hypothetical protein
MLIPGPTNEEDIVDSCEMWAIEGQLKNPMTSSGIEPATFQPVA